MGNCLASRVLERLESIERERSALDAERLELIANYHDLRAGEGEFAARSASTEVALALRISHGQAEAQVRLAQNLTERLPETFAALKSGRVDLAKANALVDVTSCLSVEDARAVESKVLPKAGDRLLGQVRASARYHRDRVDPEGAEERRQQARAQRYVSFESVEDGSAELFVRGPGERVFLAWQLVDTMARQLRAAGDERNLDELRFDLLLDLILGKYGSRVRVRAYLHVPATTLAGIGTDPGILAGYGAVTAEACRELASRDAIWRRVFCDLVTGTVKDVDRKSYRPPDALTEYIAVRDGTCIAPGCTRPAQHCQIDHTVRWVDGGSTSETNLDSLCHRDHRLKELCGWTLTQPEPGHFTWISPVGQRYERLPESILDP